jgi:hypothetical protein
MKTFMMLLGMIAIALGGVAGDYYYLVPAAAHVSGAHDTNWRTDVLVYNNFAAMTQYDLMLLKENADNSDPQTVTQFTTDGITAEMPWNDILWDRFHYEGGGAVLVKCHDCVRNSMLVSSRTYNDLRAEGKGTYGQFVAGFAQDDLLTTNQLAKVMGLYRDAVHQDFRNNLGIASMSPTAIGVTVQVWDQLHHLVVNVNQPVPPYGWVQINDILGQVTDADATYCYANVWSETPGAVFMAYVSVVDNTSGDAIFVPARR